MGIGRTNTGGGIKLHVVGGTSRPGSAAENTIWLNTSTAIPKWGIQNDAPGSPAAGEVYITTRNVTSNVLNISSPNAVKVYLGTARQYVNNAWVDLDGQVYYSGSWHKLLTFVYDGSLNAGEGNFNTAIGGVWVNYRGVYAKNTDSFSLTTNIQGDQHVNTQNVIDFTEVNQVKITFTRHNEGNHYAQYFCVYQSSPAYPAVQYTPPEVANKTTITMDVSGLTGNYYLGYYENANTSAGSVLTVYSIELAR